jgi:probable rRNA maturation factor
MQKLNETFRGEDKTTDVLSFNQDVLDPETGRMYLGDILISIPTAKKQAANQGHPLDQECAFLAIHGTLHLLGYDHYDPEEKATMWAIQDRIFKKLSSAAGED